MIGEEENCNENNTRSYSERGKFFQRDFHVFDGNIQKGNCDKHNKVIKRNRIFIIYKIFKYYYKQGKPRYDIVKVIGKIFNFPFYVHDISFLMKVSFLKYPSEML